MLTDIVEKLAADLRADRRLKKIAVARPRPPPTGVEDATAYLAVREDDSLPT